LNNIAIDVSDKHPLLQTSKLSGISKDFGYPTKLAEEEEISSEEPMCRRPKGFSK